MESWSHGHLRQATGGARQVALQSYGSPSTLPRVADSGRRRPNILVPFTSVDPPASSLQNPLRQDVVLAPCSFSSLLPLGIDHARDTQSSQHVRGREQTMEERDRGGTRALVGEGARNQSVSAATRRRRRSSILMNTDDRRRYAGKGAGETGGAHGRDGAGRWGLAAPEGSEEQLGSILWSSSRFTGENSALAQMRWEKEAR